MNRQLVCEFTEDVLAVQEGQDLYIEINGNKVAKSTEYGWEAIAPGWKVEDDYLGAITITSNGVSVH